VWSDGPLGYAAARVDDQAHLYTSFGEVDAARFVTERELRWESMFATTKGTFFNGDLRIHQTFGDIGPITIEDNIALYEGSDREKEILFEYNDACSDAQASLG